MITLQDLPALNACLNTASAFCLVAGYVMIRRDRRIAHRNFMIGALTASALFLTSYLIYHFNAGRTHFRNPEWARWIYFPILISHTILAVAILPLVISSVVLAVRARYEAHRKVSRWTLPLWLYVSVTGVVIYLMLYQIWPQQPSAH